MSFTAHRFQVNANLKPSPHLSSLMVTSFPITKMVQCFSISALNDPLALCHVAKHAVASLSLPGLGLDFGVSSQADPAWTADFAINHEAVDTTPVGVGSNLF